VPYFDTGVYSLFLFDNSNEEIAHIKNINAILGIDYRSKPPEELPYPLINA